MQHRCQVTLSSDSSIVRCHTVYTVSKLLYHLVMSRPEALETPKHRQVYRALEGEILGGRWKEGDRLPSEADLVRQFGASRITVGRAVRDLQRAGLVERRAGSGTYVRTKRTAALSFGLL